MSLTPEKLLKIMPKSGGKALEFCQPLIDAFAEFGIDTPARQAMVLANMAVETQELQKKEEALSYRAERMATVWKHRFAKKDSDGNPLIGVPNDLAKSLAGKPEVFANHVYANRLGNGDAASGDGWRYRGRGGPQLTGKANYEACGKALGLDLVNSPDLLFVTKYSCRAACWFAKTHGVLPFADKSDCAGARKAWQGGSEGLDRVTSYFTKALALLQAK
jgi:putative chitinase